MSNRTNPTELPHHGTRRESKRLCARVFRPLTLIACGCAFLTSLLVAADSPSLDPHLESLRPWLGKTWRGEFKESKPDRPVVDVALWERALNGKAVRIQHSINDGVYGGESIVTWDEGAKAVVYHYFTTAGFMTKGTMTLKDGVVETLEVVSGDANGITEVRGRTEMGADGTFHVKTEYRKDGVWAPGREATYKPAPEAKVIFK